MKADLLLVTLLLFFASFVPTSLSLLVPTYRAHLPENSYSLRHNIHLELANVDGQTEEEDEDSEMLSMEAFQRAKEKVQAKEEEQQAKDDLEGFDGYMLRDVIYEKWGACYDVDFNRVDSFGFRKLYLNIMPFQLGRRPFRHETELDYLCHLQAVVEILQKYNQLEYILYQIQESDKTPRPGTSPIVAVPLRLDLTPEQVNKIMNY